ncbi:DNA-binding response regulator [Pandoraea sputorum]|nr:DNA-binding response regulator [Pandoraea sputorum]
MTRIIVADDHTLIRAGLQRILAGIDDLELVGEAANGAQAVTLLERSLCDVLLLDLSMPGRSGIDLISHIKASFPKVAILVLTMHGEEQYAVRALKAGASGYLTKDSAPAELVLAVRKVDSGGVYSVLLWLRKLRRIWRVPWPMVPVIAASRTASLMSS